MATRAEFLERLRREVRRTPGLFTPSAAERSPRAGATAEAVRRQIAERWPEALERFRQEFEQVNGVFHRVARPEEVAAVVRAIARERGVREVLAWDPLALGLDLRRALEPEGLGVIMPPPDGHADARARYRDTAARVRVGVTGADFALAETGTLILLSGAGRPRSTSLLPETHVAVFGPAALLETLEQVGIMLEALHAGPEPATSGAMINFITGPSRTADIELTLTRGVHGPKEVHAVFVESW